MMDGAPAPQANPRRNMVVEELSAGSAKEARMKFVVTVRKGEAELPGATVLEREADPDDATIEHMLVESRSDLRLKMPMRGVIEVEPLD